MRISSSVCTVLPTVIINKYLFNPWPDIDLEDIATILGDLSGIFTGVEDPEETSVKGKALPEI